MSMSFIQPSNISLSILFPRLELPAGWSSHKLVVIYWICWANRFSRFLIARGWVLDLELSVVVILVGPLTYGWLALLLVITAVLV